MKKIIVLVLLIVSILLLGRFTSTVEAIKVNPTCAGEIPNELEIDVTQTVKNDADSGLHGYWAFDNYVRHIKVWKLQRDGHHYCADVRYDGTFDVQPGVLSPQNGNPLTGNEDGTMTGGRRATIDGELKGHPDWSKTGDVGTFDYKCNLEGSCSGLVNWTDQYFKHGGEDNKHYTYADIDWGWTYKSCGHGQWVNALSGNSGDIVIGPTDEVCTKPDSEPQSQTEPRSEQLTSAGAPDGPRCEAPTWAPTLTYVGRENGDPKFQWTMVKDGLHTYVMWYGPSKDQLLWNTIVTGESITLHFVPKGTIWAKVAGYDQGCLGPFSILVDP